MQMISHFGLYLVPIFKKQTIVHNLVVNLSLSTRAGSWVHIRMSRTYPQRFRWNWYAILAAPWDSDVILTYQVAGENVHIMNCLET